MRSLLILAALLALFTSPSKAAYYQFGYDAPTDTTRSDYLKIGLADSLTVTITAPNDGDRPASLVARTDMGIGVYSGLVVDMDHTDALDAGGLNPKEKLVFQFSDTVYLENIQLNSWDFGAIKLTTFFDGTETNYTPEDYEVNATGLMTFNSILAIASFSIQALENCTSLYVDGINVVTAVPLPAAFPLYAAGMGVMGFLGWRRKKSAAAS